VGFRRRIQRWRLLKTGAPPVGEIAEEVEDPNSGPPAARVAKLRRVASRTRMAQLKFYGLRPSLMGKKQAISNAAHGVVMEVLGLPAGKRAHRFFPLEQDDFFMPEGRSEAYLIVEVVMMYGRTKETRKRLVRRLYDALAESPGLDPVDLEICIIESPPENWGFRGIHGDEAQLPYDVRR